MDRQEILKEEFNKMVYKMKLAEEFGSIFTPFYEKPEYTKNGIIENTVKLYLNEGLVTTYPSYKLIEIIVKKFNYPKDYIEEITINNKNSNVDSRIILYFFNMDFFEELKKCVDVCGYYITTYESTGHSKYKNVYIEPKFNTESFSAKDLVEKFNIKKLYHVCRKEVEPQILSKGLCPRSQSKELEHPERVYFFIQYNEEGFIDFAKQKYEHGVFVVFGTEVNSLPEYTIFEPDVAYNGYAIFTKNNIHPCNLEKIFSFEI